MYAVYNNNQVGKIIYFLSFLYALRRSYFADLGFLGYLNYGFKRHTFHFSLYLPLFVLLYYVPSFLFLSESRLYDVMHCIDIHSSFGLIFFLLVVVEASSSTT